MSRYLRRRRARGVRLALMLVALLACAYAAGLMRAGLPGEVAAPTPSPERETRSLTLDEYRFYAIQFGAFDNDADARELTNSLTARGAAGYVLTDTRSRAIGAAYTSREDADKVCANLAAQNIEAYVYEVAAPRVELRVTAEPALLDAIEAALPIAAQAIDELGAQALALDRADTSAEQVRAGLDAIAQPARAALTRLETQLGGRTHALTSGLISELNAVCDACDALSQQSVESAMDFSGKIKYNVIDLMHRHVQFMDLLIQPAASA